MLDVVATAIVFYGQVGLPPNEPQPVVWYGSIAEDISISDRLAKLREIYAREFVRNQSLRLDGCDRS